MLYRLEDGCAWGVGQTLVCHEVLAGGGIVGLVAASTWLYSPSQNLIVVSHERLLRAVPWISEGMNARVILPMYAREFAH